MQHWYPAYIALGSNQSNPLEQVKTAIDNIAAISNTRMIAQSSFYRSAPYGPVDQEEFINAACSVLTQLSPQVLMQALLDIESNMGRLRAERWGPRIIDLDLLVYVGHQSDTDFLQLPHPEIAKRNFVLLPLNDLAPQLLIPKMGRVAHLLKQCEGGEIAKIID